jgi:hypothetical protein
MNINQVLEAARHVEQARAALKEAEAQLANLTGAGPAPGRPQPARRPVRGASTPSISKRVLQMVLNSGRAGIARRDIIDVIGPSHEAAVHSALKLHQRAQRIQNDAGQWVATAEYVASLQLPGNAERQTRPIPSPYLQESQ